MAKKKMAKKKTNARRALCSAPDAEPGATDGNSAVGAQGSASSAEHGKPALSGAQGPSTGSGRTELVPYTPPPKAKARKPRKPRHDGWTEARKKTFLAVLRESGCVADACRVAGISTTSAYRLRRRDPAMAELWDAALADGLRGLVAVAHEHATIGKETVIYRGGAEVERRVAPSDSLMALLIKRGDLGGRIGSRTADQVITWEEWQDGVRFDADGKKIDEREEAEQVRASLDRKLETMRRGFLARDAKEREAENARLHAAEERIRAAEQRAAELEARNAARRGGRAG